MNQNTFPIVILAGGLATRLRPLTETIPKALIDINGEPFIAHQLRLLRNNGIKEVTLCLGYLGEMVEEYVGHGHQFGVNVTYSFDGPKLLGTAGAIKQALPLLGENFFVLYGDSYLTCDYAAVQTTFIASQKTALMTVFRNLGQWDKSNVEFANGNILVYDKTQQTDRMHHIDYGLGIFNQSAFTHIAANQIYDLALLYQDLLRNQQLAAHEVTERFYEVGSFAGINELSVYLNQAKSASTILEY
ncbi:MAG: nucleotidyltransferase family protein [Gammaproteobacteria bacterium]